MHIRLNYPRSVRTYYHKLETKVVAHLYNWRSNLVEQGLFNLARKLRYVVLAMIMVRFIIISSVLGQPIHLPLWLPLLYFGYLLALKFYTPLATFLSFNTSRGKFYQIVLDIVFITAVFRICNDAQSDIYLCYLLPLLLAARYLPERYLVGLVLSVMGAMAWVCWNAPYVQGSTALPPPLQEPSRYLIVLAVLGLHFPFSIYVRLIEQQRAALGKNITVGGYSLAVADNAGSKDEQTLAELTPSIAPAYQQTFSYKTCNLVNQLTAWSLSAADKTQPVLLVEVVNIVRDVLGCETAAVFLVEKGRAWRKTVSGIPAHLLPNEAYWAGEGLTGQVIGLKRDGEIFGQIVLNNWVHATNTANNANVREYKRHLPSGQLRHLLALPIYSDNRLIGILRVMNKLEKPGSRQHAPLGFVLDDVATLSIVATILGSALQQRANRQRLERLKDISEQLMHQSSEENIYKYVREQAEALLDIEDCTIFEVTSDGRYLRLVTSSTIPAEEAQEWQREVKDAKGCGLTSFVAATGKPLFFNDASYTQHYAYRGYNKHYEHLASKNCQAMIILPLLDYEGNCRGVMRVLNPLSGPERINHFSSEDYQTAQIMASQLAHVLRREYHYRRKIEQKEHRVSLQNQLLDLEQYILSNLSDAPRVLQKIADVSEELLEAGLVCIYPFLQGPPGLQQERRQWLCVSQGRRSNVPIQAPRPDGTSQRVLESAEGYAIIDLLAEPDLANDFLRHEGITHILGVRMEAEGNQLGVVFFDFRERGSASFSEEELRLAQIIAHMTTLTVLNAEMNMLKDLNLLRTEKDLAEQKLLLDDLLDHLTFLWHELRGPAIYANRLLDSLITTQSVIPDQTEILHRVSKLLRVLHTRIDRTIEIRQHDWSGPQQALVDIADVVEEAVYAQLELARHRGVRLVCLSDASVPLIYADSRFLQDILKILIANALDFTPSEESVKINYGYEETERSVYVDVKDKGPGVASGEITHIFERYYKGSNQAARVTTGTGLGLFFAKRFAEANKGKIVVISQPDGGSCFRLMLPVAANPGCEYAYQLGS